jgi:phosphoribosylanthranilate isomerase
MNPAPPERTRIKVCGVRTPETARAAADAGADAIGLVFAAGSPRQLDVATAVSILDALPPLVLAVAVFRNQPSAAIASWPGVCVQLHGEESERDALAARTATAWMPRIVIRGFKFDEAAVRRWDCCPHVAALLIDGTTAGGGEAFDHRRLASLMPQLRKPVILAGGLTAENVGAAIHAVRPFGVDVSSGVESSRGVKEAGLIREFCTAVREADASPAQRT